MRFIVKLFPEITIKSPPVRKQLVKQLRDNLRRQLRRVHSEIDVQRDWEKIEIEAPDLSDPSESRELREQVMDVLERTSGIASFAPVQVVPLASFDEIAEHVVALWREALRDKTFAVRVKRSGEHDFTSFEMERHIGAVLRARSEARGVKLKDPDVTVRIEVRGERVFLLEEFRHGQGGFPIGSQDDVLSLISGGFDSTVSTYQLMRRGLRTHFCFFNLGGRQHEIGVKEMSHYLWERFGSGVPVQFVTVPFEGVVAEILDKVDNSQMGVILKRMMLRAAARIAEEAGVPALATGESVAQVSSQTLVNLSVIERATDMLVLRPLVTTDKGEIIRIARDIGTEAFAAAMPEYCGVISVKPTTRARMERIEAQEAHFDFAVLDDAIARADIQPISRVLDDLVPPPSVEVLSVPLAEAVILDVRHPAEIERAPLKLSGARVEPLPFYELDKRFPELPTDTRYLLYCDRGVMSRLHAELLHEQGHRNVAVYRPVQGSDAAEGQGA